MTNMNDIIRSIVNDKISDIHTVLPAKIEKYDTEKMRARIVLLAKVELEGEMVEAPPIIEVPVSFLKAGPFVIRPPYQKEDPVLVAFSEKAHDKLLIRSESTDPKFKRMHSFDDAIVIGGLQLEQDTDLNNDYGSDLLIENQEEDTRWVMKADGTTLFENKKADYSIKADKDGQIDIECSKEANITAPKITAYGETHLGDDGGEGLSLGESLKEWLDKHTHKGVSTGSGTSGTPNSDSPDASTKVFTN